MKLLKAMSTFCIVDLVKNLCRWILDGQVLDSEFLFFVCYKVTAISNEKNVIGQFMYIYIYIHCNEVCFMPLVTGQVLRNTNKRVLFMTAGVKEIKD